MTGLFCSTVVAAFGAHFTKYPLDQYVTREGWHRLASYSLGIIFLYPEAQAFFVEGLRSLEYSEAEIRKLKTVFFSAYFGSAVAFGLGTGVGWLVYDGAGRARD